MKIKHAVLMLGLTILFSCQTKEKEPESLPPPMGWNSWNWYGKNNIDEEKMKQCMDAMVDSGLLDAGYEFFVIDGGWRHTELGANGELLSHPDKFPKGMKYLADYAHSIGLKFGLHTVPGTHDCGRDPVGGFGNEAVHIQQFMDWGVDFVKLDKCKHEDGWDEEKIKATYFKWRKVLDEKTNGKIVLSVSAYKWRDWYPEVCTMARTTRDIAAHVTMKSVGHMAVFDDGVGSKKKRGYGTVMEIAEENSKWAQYAGNGYWNDPDMLVTGEQGLNFEEQKSHFALGCIMSSPLFLGNDPLHMTEEEKHIVLNKEAIAINQDQYEQGKKILTQNDIELWAKNLTNGDVAVLLLNRNKTISKSIQLNLQDLGLTGKVKVRDVYASRSIDPVVESSDYFVDPISSLFLLLSIE